MKTTASANRSRGVFSRRLRKEAPPKSSSHASESGGIIGTILDSFVHAWHTVKSFVDGLSQDLRRAGLTLMWMAALGVFAALLLVSAWLALMAMLTLWLVTLGMGWIAAIGVVAAVNLTVAVVVIFISYRLSRNFLFPITRRKLG